MFKSGSMLLVFLTASVLPLYGQDRAKRVKPTRQIVYKKAGDKELLLHVFEPPGHKADAKRPAIVFFHGGAWSGGAPNQFYPQCAYLARRGMWAASAQYRLKPEVKVAECVEDAKAAILYVRQNSATLGVDPDRIAAGGGSAGGQLAAATALAPDGGAKSGSAGAGCKPNLLVLFNPALFHIAAEKTLVLEHFTPQTPPGIQFYGTKDAMLNYGKDCLERGRKLGFVVEVYTAENADHGFFNTTWFEPTLCQADRFLTKHGYLKGDPTLNPPEGTKLTQLK